MIVMRGWVFLTKNTLKGAPHRHQSFADSLCDTVTLGANDEVNCRNLIHRFEEVLHKMRKGHVDLTSNFPAPLVVPSRKLSKRPGQEGQPLVKHQRGVSVREQDMLGAFCCSRKIRKHFENTLLALSVNHL